MIWTNDSNLMYSSQLAANSPRCSSTSCNCRAWESTASVMSPKLPIIRFLRRLTPPSLRAETRWCGKLTAASTRAGENGCETFKAASKSQLWAAHPRTVQQRRLLPPGASDAGVAAERRGAGRRTRGRPRSALERRPGSIADFRRVLLRWQHCWRLPPSSCAKSTTRSPQVSWRQPRSQALWTRLEGHAPGDAAPVGIGPRPRSRRSARVHMRHLYHSEGPAVRLYRRKAFGRRRRPSMRRRSRQRPRQPDSRSSEGGST